MIRHCLRKVHELNGEDIFSLDNGATWHVCSFVTSGVIGVHTDDPTASLIHIDDPADQDCLVQIETVRVKVTNTIDVDVRAWATKHDLGLLAENVRRDVKRYFATENIIPEHLALIAVPAGQWADPSQGDRK